MENQDQLPEEEITNPKLFQVDPNPEDGDDEENQNGTAGYTPGETEFADGEGTLLDQGSEELEIDERPEDLDDQDTDPENDPDSASSNDPEDAD